MFSLSGIELDLLPHLTPTTNFQTSLLQALPANNQPPNARNAWEQNVSQSIQETLTNCGQNSGNLSQTYGNPGQKSNNLGQISCNPCQISGNLVNFPILDKYIKNFAKG